MDLALPHDGDRLVPRLAQGPIGVGCENTRPFFRFGPGKPPYVQLAVFVLVMNHVDGVGVVGHLVKRDRHHVTFDFHDLYSKSFCGLQPLLTLAIECEICRTFGAFESFGSHHDPAEVLLARSDGIHAASNYRKNRCKQAHD